MNWDCLGMVIGIHSYTFPSAAAKQCPEVLYLEGQGDLATRLITPITQIVTLLIPLINLLTKSP